MAGLAKHVGEAIPESDPREIEVDLLELHFIKTYMPYFLKDVKPEILERDNDIQQILDAYRDKKLDRTATTPKNNELHKIKLEQVEAYSDRGVRLAKYVTDPNLSLSPQQQKDLQAIVIVCNILEKGEYVKVFDGDNFFWLKRNDVGEYETDDASVCLEIYDKGSWGRVGGGSFGKVYMTTVKYNLLDTDKDKITGPKETKLAFKVFSRQKSYDGEKASHEWVNDKMTLERNVAKDHKEDIDKLDDMMKHIVTIDESSEDLVHKCIHSAVERLFPKLWILPMKAPEFKPMKTGATSTNSKVRANHVYEMARWWAFFTKHGRLYFDWKPENMLYNDESESNVMLADIDLGVEGVVVTESYARGDHDNHLFQIKNQYEFPPTSLGTLVKNSLVVFINAMSVLSTHPSLNDPLLTSFFINLLLANSFNTHWTKDAIYHDFSMTNPSYIELNSITKGILHDIMMSDDSNQLVNNFKRLSANPAHAKPDPQTGSGRGRDGALLAPAVWGVLATAACAAAGAVRFGNL